MNTINKILNRQDFTIKGVHVRTLTDNILRQKLSNINYVILLATKDEPNTPILYQRYADYIDKESLDSLRLQECEQPYHIDSNRYPLSSKHIKHIAWWDWVRDNYPNEQSSILGHYVQSGEYLQEFEDYYSKGVEV